MKFLVGECGPTGSGNLLLQPLYEGADVLAIWERYRFFSKPEAFALIVWRVVEARHVEAASKLVRESPSHPKSTVEPDIGYVPKETTNDCNNDRPDRDHGDDWRRNREPGDRGRGRIIATREPVATGDPWD